MQRLFGSSVILLCCAWSLTVVHGKAQSDREHFLAPSIETVGHEGERVVRHQAFPFPVYSHSRLQHELVNRGQMAHDSDRRTEERLLLRGVLAALFLTASTTTTTSTSVSVYTCTKSTTACAGRRRRAVLMDLIEDDDQAGRLLSPSNVQTIEATSLMEEANRATDDAVGRTGRYFYRFPASQSYYYPAPQSAPFPNLALPELESSQQHHPAANNHWAADRAGGAHNRGYLESLYSLSKSVLQSTVTRTAIVISMSTSTSTPSCSTAGVLPQCPNIGFAG